MRRFVLRVKRRRAVKVINGSQNGNGGGEYSGGIQSIIFLRVNRPINPGRLEDLLPW
jgi:hypothetical protein